MAFDDVAGDEGFEAAEAEVGVFGEFPFREVGLCFEAEREATLVATERGLDVGGFVSSFFGCALYFVGENLDATGFVAMDLEPLAGIRPDVVDVVTTCDDSGSNGDPFMSVPRSIPDSTSSFPLLGLLDKLWAFVIAEGGPLSLLCGDFVVLLGLMALPFTLPDPPGLEGLA